MQNKLFIRFGTAFRVRNVSGSLEKWTSGARFSKAPESFRARKVNFKSPKLKNQKILRFETLHKCKVCLNVKPVDIKSSVHQRLRGF